MKTFIGFILMSALLIPIACNGNKSKSNTANPVAAEQKDKIEDKTANKVEDKIEDKELKTCLDVVVEIVTTSPFYLEKKALEKEIIKNGGRGIGFTIEGSPDPESDGALEKSKTYDFNICEIYPDKNTSIVRITFDPKKKKLYKYDIIEDKHITIDFNRDLLKLLDELCGK